MVGDGCGPAAEGGMAGLAASTPFPSQALRSTVCQICFRVA